MVPGYHGVSLRQPSGFAAAHRCHQLELIGEQACSRGDWTFYASCWRWPFRWQARGDASRRQAIVADSCFPAEVCEFLNV